MRRDIVQHSPAINFIAPCRTFEATIPPLTTASAPTTSLEAPAKRNVVITQYSQRVVQWIGIYQVSIIDGRRRIEYSAWFTIHQFDKNLHWLPRNLQMPHYYLLRKITSKLTISVKIVKKTTSRSAHADHKFYCATHNFIVQSYHTSTDYRVISRCLVTVSCKR